MWISTSLFYQKLVFHLGTSPDCGRQAGWRWHPGVSEHISTRLPHFSPKKTSEISGYQHNCHTCTPRETHPQTHTDRHSVTLTRPDNVMQMCHPLWSVSVSVMGKLKREVWFYLCIFLVLPSSWEHFGSDFFQWWTKTFRERITYIHVLVTFWIAHKAKHQIRINFKKPIN